MKSGKDKRAAVAAAPGKSKPAWPYVIALAAALVAVLQVYSPALNGPFLLDDSYLPYLRPNFNPNLKAWVNGVRPMLMFSYWLNFQQSGNQVTFPYHLVNVVLHFANGVFAYLAVRKVLGLAKVEQWRLEPLAVFAGGLFLLHPLQTESVSYVASRSETLSVFFALAAYVVFLYRRPETISFLTSAAVLALYAAACLTKEHALALAGLLLLTDYFWNPGFSFDGIRRNWRLYAPAAIAGAAGLALIWRVLANAKTAGFGMKDITWYGYFFTQCRAIWDYARLFVLPFGQNLDHDFPISRTIVEHGAILGFVALIAAVALAWIYRKRAPLISYGAFAFLILIAPTSSFVPIQDPLVERRLYLPFIGLLFIAVGALRRWTTTRNSLIAALAAVLAIEAALSYRRNQLWGDAIALWSDSAGKSPGKVRPNFQLAYAFYGAGQCAQAATQFEKTAALAAPDYSLLVDWALAQDCAGNPSGAIAKLREAAALEPGAHVYSQIGMEYAKQSKFTEALAALDHAAALDPNFEMTYIYRGNVYRIQGDRQRAAEDYRRALAIDPASQYARDGLAQVSSGQVVSPQVVSPQAPR